MNKRSWAVYILSVVSVCACFIFGVPACADAADYAVQGTRFEKDGEDNFDSPVARNGAFSYGENSIGKLTISGEINEQDSYEGITAFGVSDNITISYLYNGDYHSEDKEQWNLCSSDSKRVGDDSLDKKISNGVIIVQKSTDGKNWTEASKPACNSFKKSNEKNSVIYTTSTEEIMQGTYYKITIAYQMKKRTGVEEKWGLIPDEETYAYKSFIEEYEFYICTDKNYITVKDIETTEALQNNAQISKGFIVCKNGSSDDVKVIRNDADTSEAEDFDAFTAPGTYSIEITTKLGKVYQQNIIISEGLSSVSLCPAVYESEKNGGFSVDGNAVDETSFGISSMTTLSISQRAGFTTTKSTVDGVDAYGINGDAVSLYLKLNYAAEEEDRDWTVTEDNWGKREKEKVNGVYVGAVGEGAIVVQKTSDGESWENIDAASYGNGLFTTDFAKYYAPKENVLIYTPDGADVISGIYLRILYAYQVSYGKTKTDCLEKYEFYLCSNELSAVTFSNLTLQSTEGYSSEDKESAEAYKSSETLTNDAGTVTGFEINTEKNPTVTYIVEKNGKRIEVPENGKFTENGKYDITLSSKVKDSEKITIYVDNSADADSLKNYFGDGFIDGKRIYDEGEYPVYEAGEGLTSYHLEEVSDEYLPVYGVIKNETTGTEIKLDPSREERNGDILEAGEYTATFKTGVSNIGAVSGDVRVFTFHFSVIENGAAPGPVVNQENLQEYARSNISDCYPIYYGVTYPSAKKGYITLAFAQEDDAIKFAYAYEKGMVEIQEDGSYRYNSSATDGQKVSFESVFDLTEAANEVSEEIVKKAYFNLEDQFTYMTLANDSIKDLEDLRALKLERSVIVFADQQKEQLIDKTTGVSWLPVIGAKKYVSLQPGDGGETVSGENDFVFIRDKYGCDSNSVVITDESGKEYSIQYDKGVAAQLREQNCPSGIITITEATKYGDQSVYKVIYIRPGENTATTEISYYENGAEKSIKLSADDDGKMIDADLFSIAEVGDRLDAYSLIIVNDGNNEWFYASDQKIGDVWSTAGDYEISVINRLGYGYSFSVHVNESDYSAVTFNGSGADSMEDILVQFGEKNVELPTSTRTGYEFAGFKDENGNIYFGKIEKIMFKEGLSLTTVWEPKDVSVKFLNSNGSEYKSEQVPFDSEYDLPGYSVQDGLKFKGWKCDGKIVESQTIKIDSEDEMIFYPVIVDESTGNEVIENDSETGRVAGWPMAGILIIFAVLAFSYANKHRKEVCENKREDDTDENS